MVINDPRVKVCSSGEDAELFIPPHLDLDVYPGWLRQRALERIPEYKDAWPNSDSDAVSRLIEKIDAWDWLDHWGTAIYGGKEYLVSEPYHMNRERIDQLLRFCNGLNLAFNIQASGHHYPTQTMRVFVWPKEWTEGDDFLQEKEGYADGRPSGDDCLALSGKTSPRRVPDRAGRTADVAREEEAAFAREEDLRDYLAGNLHVLERGMTLWPVGRGQRALEFTVDARHRRIDILARDASGIPTVIETKVHKGHERTVGQVLYYQERVREKLNVEKVRVLIVAKQISAELRAATARLPDVALLEYSRTIDLRKL
ncbi:MAG: endonuclease NucS domain-containing protein [Terriglobia bacterium]|jgi:hypothetical protein